MSFWLIFLAGITLGGLGCMAVQGGLLAAQTAGKKSAEVLLITLVFLFFRLLAYTLLGFLLGLVGRTVSVNSQVQSLLQLFAGIYMLMVAGNLLDLHPWFRYVIISPPRFLAKITRRQSRISSLFSPAILGLMTVFLPCGTTIAMETLAVSSANVFTGAAIMFVFVISSTPWFLGLGFLTSRFGAQSKYKLIPSVALLVIMGLFSLNSALVSLNSPLAFRLSPRPPVQKQVTQNAEIIITASGYSPNYLVVKAGQPVTLTVIGENNFSCASAFRIPSLNLGVNLPPNGRQTFTFTPAKPGKISFSCSMGMYSGIIEAI